MGELKCLNPWDPQSKRQYRTDGVYRTLDAGHGAGGQMHGVCYALEGNGSRPSHQGVGYSGEGKMYTLNTIETHCVCYGVDCRNATLDREITHTLQAKPNGGASLNCTPSILMETQHEQHQGIPDPEPPAGQPGHNGLDGDYPNAGL